MYVNREPAPMVSSSLQDSFQKLTASAAKLNAITDEEVARAIEHLEAALKRLNLEVITWAEMETGDMEGQVWWSHGIGYYRGLGIALRAMQGGFSSNERVDEHRWRFNEASRSLRIEGIQYLPNLLEKLVEETEATTERVELGIAEASQLTSTNCNGPQKLDTVLRRFWQRQDERNDDADDPEELPSDPESQDSR
jgi:hypothetical protein